MDAILSFYDYRLSGGDTETLPPVIPQKNFLHSQAVGM